MNIRPANVECFRHVTSSVAAERRQRSIDHLHKDIRFLSSLFHDDVTDSNGTPNGIRIRAATLKGWVAVGSMIRDEPD